MFNAMKNNTKELHNLKTSLFEELKKNTKTNLDIIKYILFEIDRDFGEIEMKKIIKEFSLQTIIKLNLK